jgi:hypothetical protein
MRGIVFMASRLQVEKELIEELALCSNDPLRFVKLAFPWGLGELKDKELEQWQIDILADIRDRLQAGEISSLDDVLRYARSAGHGVGKSALVSWLILWALCTFEDTRGVVTANTAGQLRTKTWAELAKWFNMCICKHWFEFTATAIFSKDPRHTDTWRIDAIPWSIHRPEAFAGLHNEGKRIIVIYDEASAVDDRIWEVSEGALTDKNTQILWFAFGNPTRNTGRFAKCFGANKHRWNTAHIDGRNVRITNKEQIAQWAKDYGEDSDFFKVRVKGEFPNVSDRQFIPQSYVDQARGKHIPPMQLEHAPVILTLDPAWTGGDELVIGKRQGYAFSILAVLRRNDDDNIPAGMLAKFEDEYKADAVIIDQGYGTGIYSIGKQMGRVWMLVSFGEGSADPGYKNKRAEMWGLMKQWLKEGGAIPDDPELAAELTGPEATVLTSGHILLESKADMKARGLASPNKADALALSFARPVRKRERLVGGMQSAKTFYNQQGGEYDPLA